MAAYDMSIEEYLQHISAEMTGVLESFLPRQGGDSDRLAQAMRYSVLNGGKRLRPALFAAALEAFDLDFAKYRQFAAALEFIHCYSLIHDDLPAMDNDTLRRGKPTCHIAFDEATAILAGDGLLNLGGELLTRPIPGTDPARQLAAANAVLCNSGLMVQGQAAELAAESPDTALLRRIYLGKTSGLFAASVLGAGYLAGAAEEQIAALKSYAYDLGLAFQIADDVLDIRGSQDKTGRPNGSDARNDKLTYAALVGCDKAMEQAAALAANAGEALKILPGGGGMLRLFPGFLVARAL